MKDYRQHFGFSKDPFGIEPDPEFFFPSESHREALASLLYGINHRKGFVLVLGAAGIGKTTLIRHAISRLGPNVRTAFIPQSGIPYEPLLKDILLKLSAPQRRDVKGAMLHDLYDHLIQCLERDENAAICLDEAQDIGLDVIEEVRLLANLETSKSKLLQLVLVGRPELMEKLRSDVIRQIKQRIVVSCRIDPMTDMESRQYIDHRLRIAGNSGARIFTEDAVTLICRLAKGNPLALNILCRNALAAGQDCSETTISAAAVKIVRHEEAPLTDVAVRGLIATRRKKRLHKTALACLIAAVAALTAFFLGNDEAKRIFLKPESVKIAEQKPFKDEGKTAAPPPQVAEVFESEKTALEDSSIKPAPVSSEEIRIKDVVAVKKGANLHMLSQQYYGEANTTFMDRILELNPDITDPNVILVDQKIRIPEITASLLVAKSSGGGFEVHIGTFLNREVALQYRERAAQSGKNVAVVARKVSKTETWHRVLAGPFAGREEGLRFLEDMKKQELLPFNDSI